jgi:hypothetical protein
MLPDADILNQELVREGVCCGIGSVHREIRCSKGLEKAAREYQKGLWAIHGPCTRGQEMSAQGARSHRANPARYHINTYQCGDPPSRRGIVLVAPGVLTPLHIRCDAIADR